MFTEPDPEMRKGDYAFMRIPQWEPECEQGKTHAIELRHLGLKLIPDFFTLVSYENKVMQSQAYYEWMPPTYVLREGETLRDAVHIGKVLGYPFVSKGMKGSSSVNVRLIKSEAEAKAEWQNAFRGDGIPMLIGKGRTATQQHYLIWQKFIRNNDCDYRVCINGQKLLLLQRDNAHGTFCASGSGKNRPINDPNPFQKGALRKAHAFFAEFDLRWNGIDLVYDYDEEDWKILETTLGWSAKAYEECTYFGTDYKGRDVWKLFLDQLEEGVFDR